jgi:hypothetical protein
MRKRKRKAVKQTERGGVSAIAVAMEEERERLDKVIVTIIRASLDDADMTQVELAASLGLPYRQVVNMLRQKKAIRASQFLLIARVLKLDPKTLVDRVLSW